LQSASKPSETIGIFDRFHVGTSMAWLVFLATHLVLHQKWIASAIQRFSPFNPAANVELNKEH
jgi:hypothetical protein